MSPTGDLHVTLIFLWGGVSLELAQGPSRVALAWHKAGSSTPFGVTNIRPLQECTIWHRHSLSFDFINDAKGAVQSGDLRKVLGCSRKTVLQT